MVRDHEASLTIIATGRLSDYQRRIFLWMWPSGIVLLLLGLVGDSKSFWDAHPFVLELTATVTAFLLGFPVAVTALAQLRKRSEVSTVGYALAVPMMYATAELARRATTHMLHDVDAWRQPIASQIAAASDAQESLLSLLEQSEAADPALSGSQLLAEMKSVVPPFDLEQLLESSPMPNWHSLGTALDRYFGPVTSAVTGMEAAWDDLVTDAATWSAVRHAAVVPATAVVSVGDVEAALRAAVTTYRSLEAFLTSFTETHQAVVDEWSLVTFDAGLTKLIPQARTSG